MPGPFIIVYSYQCATIHRTVYIRVVYNQTELS